MESIYTVLYGDQPLGTQVCSVEANAFGTAKDDYGHPYEELLYSTRLGSDQDARINWNTARTEGVNFPRIWTLNYKSPKVEQAEDQFEMEQAIDCAVDEGIFDNWFCPR